MLKYINAVTSFVYISEMKLYDFYHLEYSKILRDSSSKKVDFKNGGSDYFSHILLRIVLLELLLAVPRFILDSLLVCLGGSCGCFIFEFLLPSAWLYKITKTIQYRQHVSLGLQNSLVSSGLAKNRKRLSSSLAPKVKLSAEVEL